MTPKIVTGENITQALQFVDTGNAELGFVALSQVIGKPAAQVWIVPADMYAPILQDAVLLKTGENDPVATASSSSCRAMRRTTSSRSMDTRSPTKHRPTC